MEAMSRTIAATPSTGDSLREYGRGFAGGLLFSVPLLYTMEVWWASFIAQPPRLVALFVMTYLLLLGYNRYAGLRHDASWVEVAIDSVEELGLGILASAGVLFLIGRIDPSTPRDEMLGKIVVEAAVLAIGFSVGSAQLGSGDRDVGKGAAGDVDPRAPGNELVMGLCGAVLLAANIAPTEEILMIAIETEPVRLLGLAILSLAVPGGILYFLDFRGADRPKQSESNMHVVMGVAIVYGIGLVTAAVLLWFFGRFDRVAPEICARQVVVLGFPAALGAATGRVLLRSS
jgi:putative integral membrane protein (TIGR02587 family)